MFDKNDLNLLQFDFSYCIFSESYFNLFIFSIITKNICNNKTKMPNSRIRKRIKKSGIIYFAVNPRCPNMVKIGMSIDSAEIRLSSANKRNEWMCGKWTITQKVKTNDVTRTENLSHKIFSEFHCKESVSTEMYCIPPNWTVKQMADIVREKDKVLLIQAEKQEAAKKELAEAKAKFDAINSETDLMIALKNEDFT